MKLEKGKFYRLRNGDKFEVYSTDNPGYYPVHGRVLNPSDSRFQTKTSDGKHYNQEYLDSRDIISEWVDNPLVDWSLYPSWAKFRAHSADGAAYVFSNRPQLDSNSGYWIPTDDIYSVCRQCLPEHTPALTCDWKDSLVERPE